MKKLKEYYEKVDKDIIIERCLEVDPLINTEKIEYYIDKIISSNSLFAVQAYFKVEYDGQKPKVYVYSKKEIKKTYWGDAVNYYISEDMITQSYIVDILVATLVKIIESEFHNEENR